MKLRIWLFAIALVVVTACSPDDEPTDPATTVESSSTEEKPQVEQSGTEQSVFGSWDRPLPMDTVLTLTAWEVTIIDVIATAEPLDPQRPTTPKPGCVNVAVEIEAVRIAPDPGEIKSFGGIGFGLMAEGVEVGENIGVYVGNPINTGMVAPGGAIRGQMIVAANVPEDMIEDSILLVHDHGAEVTAYVEWQ
jgi:hypothetical protein